MSLPPPPTVGAWTRIHGLAGDTPHPYGRSVTYRLAADWLAPCARVEDWGCGLGWARQFFPSGSYIGVDGSETPHADVIADLAAYRSQVPGVLLRHVLEHNHRWRDVLANALASATERLCVVLFTPPASAEAGTHVIAVAEDPPGIPDLSFWLPDLTDPIEEAGFAVEVETRPSRKTQYKVETILRCARRG